MVQIGLNYYGSDGSVDFHGLRPSQLIRRRWAGMGKFLFDHPSSLLLFVSPDPAHESFLREKTLLNLFCGRPTSLMRQSNVEG